MKFHVFGGYEWDPGGGMSDYIGYLSAEEIKGRVEENDCGDVAIVNADGWLEKVAEWDPSEYPEPDGKYDELPTKQFRNLNNIPELAYLEELYPVTTNENQVQ